METTLSKNELQLSCGRLRPLFLHYALPGIGAMLFLALQSIADGLIVGRLIGTTALAAVNIVIPVYTLVTAVALMIGVGTQAQIGILTGQGDYTGAKTALISGLIGLIFFTVTATVGVNIFADEIAVFLGADNELLPLSTKYIYGLMPWLAGIGFQLFFDYTLKALGHPRFAMMVMIGTILLNIVSSVVFVAYFGMGTFGTGLGTGISFSLGAVVSGCMIARQLRKNTGLSAAHGRFSLKTFGHLFYNGSSEGLTEIAAGFIVFLFNITLRKYVGAAGVAAFTLVDYLMFIGTSVILGISNGTIPVISYNWGARRISRVKGIVRLALMSNLACGAVMILLLWVCGRAAVGLFIGSSEAHVIDLAVRGAKFMSLAFLFNGFNILASSFFTAIDKPGLSLVVASLRGPVLLVSGILSLPRWFGVDGIWLAMPLADALTAVIVLLLTMHMDNIFGRISKAV